MIADANMGDSGAAYPICIISIDQINLFSVDEDSVIRVGSFINCLSPYMYKSEISSK